VTSCSVIVSGEDEDGTRVYWGTEVESGVAAYRLGQAANTDRLCVSVYDPQARALTYSRPGETEFHQYHDA